jgi:short-subunit dehydrogenase
MYIIATNSLMKKNVLLTGASGGIGQNLAIEFAKAGCNLFLTGRSEKKLKILREQILKIGEDLQVFYKSCNLDKEDDLKSLVSNVRERLESVDVLVNCAGEFIVKKVGRSTLEDFDRCFNVNVKAPFFLSKVFSADMVQREWGRIINIGSSSSYSGYKNTSLYCSSKHALLGFSRSLHDELKDYNIRTFCFSPGSVKTDMGKKVENQDFSTFIGPGELARYIVITISFDSGMISEEVKINRFSVQ